MLVKNLIHEFRLLSRNYWFLSLSVLFAILALYAGYNGSKIYEFRSLETVKVMEDQQALLDRAYKVVEAVENGETPNNMYRLSPMNFSIATGALATKSSSPMSMLAIGQSDLYSHQIRISSRDDIATLTFNDMSNPVQLLFGNFDIAFVLTYLIPLIIIAFTYNLHSFELETGRIKLLASQPINTSIWLMQRYLTRFLSLSVMLGLAVVLTIIVYSIPMQRELFGMIILTYAYMLFWFSISFLVNVFGKSSRRNAVALLSIWMVLVLIIPSVVSQTANSIYPTPSRVVLLNEIRQKKQDLGKEQDKVVAEYLRNHPELAIEDGDNPYARWQGIFASQVIMEESLSPLVNGFDEQIESQQDWVKGWRFLSPAILFQSSFTELAGTSSRQYNEYKNHVKDFTAMYRDYFIPFVFENRMLARGDIETLPTFSYESSINMNIISFNIFTIILGSFVVVFIGLRRQRIQLQT